MCHTAGGFETYCWQELDSQSATLLFVCIVRSGVYPSLLTGTVEVQVKRMGRGKKRREKEKEEC